MAYEFPGAGALDYSPCSYGGSGLVFRGPLAQLDEPYVAVLGGTATYGRFVEHPYPALLADRLGQGAVNLGIQNAGLDVFLNDGGVLDIARQATAIVLQVPGVSNQTNQYFSVHPRRNDRFLAASQSLRALFPQIDFTEYAFTRHLLAALKSADGNKFAVVKQELRRVWQERMSALLSRLPPNVILLYLRHLSALPGTVHPALESEPLFVDDRLLSRVCIKGAEVVEVVPSPASLNQGLGEMILNPTDRAQAALLPNPAFHREIAEKLAAVIVARQKNQGRR